MEICRLWTPWAHEYMAIFVNIDGYRMLVCFKRAGGT